MTAHDELLYWASVNYHPLYERALREDYENEHGCHFDECYARKAVDDMHSFEKDGKRNKGEHWSIEQVKALIVPYKDKMSEADTCWDAYVACNMWWHDLHRNYEKHGEMDGHLVEDALTWAFCDEDAPDGKLWKYIHEL